jgi:hypothetical protein
MAAISAAGNRRTCQKLVEKPRIVDSVPDRRLSYSILAPARLAARCLLRCHADHHILDCNCLRIGLSSRTPRSPNSQEYRTIVKHILSVHITTAALDGGIMDDNKSLERSA